MTRMNTWLGRALVTLLLLSSLSSAWAQGQHAFRVTFTDKVGSPSLSDPLLFLSQRALDRRANQGIAVDITDQPVSPLYIDTVLNLTSGVLHVTSKWMNDCVVLVSDSADIAALQGKPWISDVKYVARYTTILHEITAEQHDNSENPPLLKTTGDPAYYSSSWNQTEFVRGECLHDASFRGQGMMIAVLDDGYNYVNTAASFDSLNNDNRIKDTYNFAKDTSHVYNNNSHGSQALSTMAAVMPNTYVGAAPLAQYALYVTEDQGSEQPIEMDNLVAALERADSIGTDVVSASIGYNTFNYPFDSVTLAEIDGKTTHVAKAVNFASAKGMLCVITAGNEGGNWWNKILTPGDADSALTVGNVNGSIVPASNSGFGPNAAGRVKPDVVALGSPAIVVNASNIPVSVPGTSFAVPQIAGFAACLWQSAPWATAAQIRQVIRATGSQFSNPGNQIGYGKPDFCEALQTLGISEAAEIEELDIVLYPNPATSEVYLLLPAHVKKAQASIIDVSGRTVQTNSATAGNNTFSVAQLSAGVYWVKVVSNNTTAIKKLIKR